ncbi:hypothetical protein N4T77_10235 [Clostridium sp. CX1]|uniref:Immunity protein 30 domain-containing protein n=1 Tax=Clostridium tanneri TaxID=3037988 RepID=A0ABU4JY07_9CLOT|nr:MULTISPECIES: hypothetical protein [unclassified Clostridium]MCT8976981.1 hypothetical protein [Clostridium sp. CX1]MDW8803044.1 hypothetical protein [Clostridium sp. A1-XYC3]
MEVVIIYNKDKIRELLINSVHGAKEVNEFFNINLSNEELLKILIEIASDDYSNDARMEACYWISNFDIELLKMIESDLLKIQEDELDSIACHILIALGKIKSKEGLKYLIEDRIQSNLYWEAQALKYHLRDIIKL